VDLQKPTSLRFRALLIGTTTGGALVGGLTGYLLGGVAVGILCGLLVGASAGLGFWLPSRV
jgi:hypothetical protein